MLAIARLHRRGVIRRVFTDNVENMLSKVDVPFERTRGSGVFNERYPASFESPRLVVIGVAADRRSLVRQARADRREIIVVNPCLKVAPMVRHLDYIRPGDRFFQMTAQDFFASDQTAVGSVPMASLPRRHPEHRRAILFIVQSLPVPAKRRTWQQARTLAEAGWEVAVLCPGGPTEPRSEIRDGVEINRFRAAAAASSRAGLAAESLAAFIRIAGATTALLWSWRFDVVKVVCPPDWLVLGAAPLRLAGIRLVADITDLSPELYEAKFGRRDLGWRLIRLTEAVALRLADLVTVPNGVMRRLVRRRGAHKVLALPTGGSHRLDTAPKAGGGPIVVGWFGVIGVQDGLAAVIDAVLALGARPDVPAFRLVVVGDGPELARIRARAAPAGDRIHFAGFLTGGAQDEALAGFDIGVIADPINRHSRTATMNKLFVYAAHGLPVLATPLPETRRLLGGAAHFTRGDDAAALAEGLAALLADGPRREALAAAIRQRPVPLWDEVAPRYCAAMAELTVTRIGSSERILLKKSAGPEEASKY